MSLCPVSRVFFPSVVRKFFCQIATERRRNSRANDCQGNCRISKSRETRPAKVAELALYRDRLPEKLRYLADAPQKDPEGNEAIIRFSRKEKHQYVTSEKNGKATKWIVDYIDGKWVERKK